MKETNVNAQMMEKKQDYIVLMGFMFGMLGYAYFQLIGYLSLLINLPILFGLFKLNRYMMKQQK